MVPTLSYNADLRKVVLQCAIAAVPNCSGLVKCSGYAGECKSRASRPRKVNMSNPPKNLKSIRADQVFEITWPDDSVYRIPFRYLRGRCPCAACVNEFTNERMVDVPDIPTAISLESAQFSGNYALKIKWNDQHDTGLFTWEHLRELCDAHEWDSMNF